jgi:REP element-mobilizing transposase RayT
VNNNRKRPILAHHLIFSAYGFWLPNDPRGSWSNFVWSWDLFRYGPATKTTSRRSVAAAPHDRQLRLQTKQALKYPPVQFNGHQALAVANGFTAAIQESKYVVYACAILPDHVHLVIQRCRRTAESIAQHLKAKATMQLTLQKLHPLKEFVSRKGEFPTPWVAGCWKCFLHDDKEIDSAIRYVNSNPVKEGKRKQNWTFVKPFVSK